ncbi:MAG: LPS translocon maturation chaperone LptM [Steroidobacteraceae bacterium]|jgi:predicted small lipoprotein YifL
MKRLVALCIILLLAACGQTGALYLPEPPAQTVVPQPKPDPPAP